MFRVRIAYITENNKKIISDSSERKKKKNWLLFTNENTGHFALMYCSQKKILVICLNDVHGT